MTIKKDIRGIKFALDHLETRIQNYHAYLSNMTEGKESGNEPDIETIAITEGEVEVVESLILDVANTVTGTSPDERSWEPLHSYCSKHQDTKETWEEQNTEYFRWARMWITKSKTYCEYLSGMTSIEDIPIRHKVAESDLTPPADKANDQISTLVYDVALSFAGHDRKHAEAIAVLLEESGCSVFYDNNEKADLWGKNLFIHLNDIYKNKARYCLMFISTHYSENLWTRVILPFLVGFISRLIFKRRVSCAA